MKTSEVLRHAKRYLAETYQDTYNYTTKTGAEKFICIAIRTAAETTKRITIADMERCKDIIRSRLDDNDTLESWLQSQGCLPMAWGFVNTATRDRIQQHRHAWLDMLITEFKSKGD